MILCDKCKTENLDDIGWDMEIGEDGKISGFNYKCKCGNKLDAT